MELWFSHIYKGWEHDEEVVGKFSFLFDNSMIMATPNLKAETIVGTQADTLSTMELTLNLCA
jgi:hypothetical protein